MLEQYFLKPATLDRLRGSWIGTEIEAYVSWLADRGYSARSVYQRVPIGFAFGEFAREHGARTINDLPAYVDAFVAARVKAHDAAYSTRPMAKEVRGPVEQMLSVVVPGYEPTGRPHHRQPFADDAPGFFDYLVEERGLRPAHRGIWPRRRVVPTRQRTTHLTIRHVRLVAAPPRRRGSRQL